MTSSSINVESTSITSSPGADSVGRDAMDAMFGVSCSSMVPIVGNHWDNGYS